MAGDWFGKRLPGDSPLMPAQVYNRLVEMAQGHALDTPGLPDAAVFRQSGVVKVRNDTGADLQQFSVVRTDEPLILPDQDDGEFRSQVTFSGTAPTAGAGFGILLEPLSIGAIGLAVVDGLAICRLAVNPDSIQDYADCFEGGTAQLCNSATGPARVLWYDDSGDTEQWAIVRLGDSKAPDDIIYVRFYSQALPANTSTYQGLWAVSTGYTVGQTVLCNDRGFRCVVAHTAAAATQPGSGSDWLTKWKISPAVILTGTTTETPSDLLNGIYTVGDKFLCANFGVLTLGIDASGHWTAEQIAWDVLKHGQRVEVGSEGVRYYKTSWQLFAGSPNGVGPVLPNMLYAAANYSVIHRANYYVGRTASVPAYTRTGNVIDFNATGAIVTVSGTVFNFQVDDIVLFNPAYGSHEGDIDYGLDLFNPRSVDAGLWVVIHPGDASGGHMIWKRAPQTLQPGAVRSGMLVIVDTVSDAAGYSFFGQNQLWMLRPVGGYAGGQTITVNTDGMVFTPVPSNNVYDFSGASTVTSAGNVRTLAFDRATGLQVVASALGKATIQIQSGYYEKVSDLSVNVLTIVSGAGYLTAATLPAALTGLGGLTGTI